MCLVIFLVFLVSPASLIIYIGCRWETIGIDRYYFALSVQPYFAMSYVNIFNTWPSVYQAWHYQIKNDIGGPTLSLRRYDKFSPKRIVNRKIFYFNISMRVCAYCSIRRFMARLLVCDTAQCTDWLRKRCEKTAYNPKVASQICPLAIPSTRCHSQTAAQTIVVWAYERCSLTRSIELCKNKGRLPRKIRTFPMKNHKNSAFLLSP